MLKHVLLLVLVAMLICESLFFSDDVLLNSTALNADEVFVMEDSDIYDALIARFMYAEPSTLNQKQLTVATLITFDAEMMNGGLCQFFANDYNGYAKYVHDALGEVGAIEMQEHYSNFVSQNDIDVTQMDSFHIASTHDYAKQFDRFPYEAFDNTFSEIYQKENLGNLLLIYARIHREEIFD